MKWKWCQLDGRAFDLCYFNIAVQNFEFVMVMTGETTSESYESNAKDEMK